jgi:hypothetical protein
VAGLRAVFLDAGNTLLALDYEEIAACFRAAGHRQVTAEAVRVAEQRARPRLDRRIGVEDLDTLSGQGRDAHRIQPINRESAVAPAVGPDQIGDLGRPLLRPLLDAGTGGEEEPSRRQPDLIDGFEAPGEVLAPSEVEQYDGAVDGHEDVACGITDGPDLHVPAARRVPDVDAVGEDTGTVVTFPELVAEPPEPIAAEPRHVHLGECVGKRRTQLLPGERPGVLRGHRDGALPSAAYPSASVSRNDPPRQAPEPRAVARACRGVVQRMKMGWMVREFANLEPARQNAADFFRAGSNTMGGLTHVDVDLIPPGDLADSWEVTHHPTGYYEGTIAITSISTRALTGIRPVSTPVLATFEGKYLSMILYTGS